MLKLSGIAIRSENTRNSRQLLSISTDKNLPSVLRKDKAFLVRGDGTPPTGFKHYLTFSDLNTGVVEGLPVTELSEEFSYLGDKDIISLSGDGHIRSIFRADSDHNSILLTEQCNNYCLMCSQPPKDVDDRWLLEEAMDTIRLMPRETKTLGITGGEPTLFGEGFIDLLRLTKNWLPHTSLHVLSNGRSFSNYDFASKYSAVNHHDLMVGIPVYSSDPARHDYVVQASGAFDETIRGILNLKRLQQRVEIRVVIHKQTYAGLPALAEFIARNLLFVDHVALMGLEMTGFTRANLDSLWIDPIEYKEELSRAVKTLNQYGLKTSVYNHPLCLINSDVLPNYVKSISDWKNEYANECNGCTRKNECGGFFSSGIQFGYSKSIKPFHKTK